MAARILPAVIAALLALMLLVVQPAAAQTTDYDTDDDRLIEIDSPAKLNAMRYDLDGDGAADAVGDAASYAAGFPSPASGQCPNPGCAGYELTTDLGLRADYPLWPPIGGAGGYNATFDGNGYAISGLIVNTLNHAGLFGRLGGSGVIREVGIINGSVTTTLSGGSAGALVGVILQGGQVAASYAHGLVTTAAANGAGGGLAGSNAGVIRASYAQVTALGGNHADTQIGGLVGALNGGTITASYAAGPASASGANSAAGGLVGQSSGSAAAITASYCDTAATMQPACVGRQTGGSSVPAPGYTPRQLKQPTGYTGIYEDWNLDLDGDPMTDDDPWDFGSRRHYPLLKIDKDGDGKATCLEFSGQRCYVYIPPAPPPYHPAHDHPEIYANPRYAMATSCAVRTTGTGDEAVTTSTLTFSLGRYTRPLTLTLSLWDGDVFRSLQSQGISMPELRREGRTATVEVVTDPAQTRFRLDSEYGLNLVLGYADCHTDDPQE